ncbi:hypothetical protein AMS58_19810 [Pseudoalteromonas porphyrae]|uniref:DUF2178 domain-containing protein n=2 Tax=Pseudoalteromonas TaxID=53246 RepID=A0A0N0M0Z0_9GAMM|nr:MULTISPECIES: hypothetical protein [Pseudoalteromonas]KPH64628.1 hypothetical protein ADS77_04965 [Pseudoalteromonas porphyrae]KPH92949.1 hypothetical protein AMS58_19810 [Pseudoalteromonas porphyrae]NMR27755.1 hypothetical protein [Pseudoalteromonas sp. NEC-BIFX-2020_015]NNG43981.1 hypothetical protein [Pseudoalteromonas sp. NEC-BIFX-2020_002]
MSKQTHLTLNQRNKMNTASLAKWTLFWMLSLAFVSFGPNLLWEGNIILSVIAVVINLAVGLMMILANKRHLQGLDEMQQRLQLNAMAITLGATLIVGLAYSSLDNSALIPFTADISHLVIFMGLTYFFTTLFMHKQLGCGEEGE